ncbi:MAG: Rv2175c family DNA-binding protein [Pseudonocardiaceae bacterium]
MTDPSKISELIERSSLGTAGARRLRDRTPPEVAQRILDRVAEHERTTENVTANPRSVADLLLGICDGDPAAWDEIVRRYGVLVSMVVRSFRLQEADALDAMQMTWLRLAEIADRVQCPEQLGGWLATTTRRECIHILRQVKSIPGLVDATPDMVADPSAGPEQHVIDAETARTLRELVAVLPSRQRTLVQMLFIDQPHSYAELAETIGIPLASIGPTRARALRQLREYLVAGEKALAERTTQLERGQKAVTEGDSSVPEGDRNSGSMQHFGEADTAWTPGELDALWFTCPPALTAILNDFPVAQDVLDPDVVVLPIPDVAHRLGLPVTGVHRMLRDGQLLGMRRQGVVVVPAEFLSGDAVVKGLSGTITLLRHVGYSAEEILRRLFTAEDSFLSTPIGALRRGLPIEILA